MSADFTVSVVLDDVMLRYTSTLLVVYGPMALTLAMCHIGT